MIMTGVVYRYNQKVFIALYREHNKGIKLGVTGTDGSDAAKTVLVDFHKKEFNIDCEFREVSQSLENVLKGHVPKVPFAQSVKIFDKGITPTLDGFYYCRSIGTLGSKKKLLIGKPG